VSVVKYIGKIYGFSGKEGGHCVTGNGNEDGNYFIINLPCSGGLGWGYSFGEDLGGGVKGFH